MSIVNKKLAQVNRTATGAYTLYTALSGVTAIIRNIMIINLDATEDHICIIYHDDTGTTASNSTVVFYFNTIASGTMVYVDNLWIPVQPQGSIMVAVGTGTPNCTFTLYGLEQSS